MKALFLGTPVASPCVSEPSTASSETDDMDILSRRWHVISVHNRWEELSPDRPLVNWQIGDGGLICRGELPDSTVFLSDYRLSDEAKSFEAEMLFTFQNELDGQAKPELRVGFRISPEGQCGDKNIDAGISGDGTLFIGQYRGDRVLKADVLKEPLRLVLTIIPQSIGGCFAKIKAFDRSGNMLAALSSTKYSSSEWQGNIGILSRYASPQWHERIPTVTVNRFRVEGEKLTESR